MSKSKITDRDLGWARLKTEMARADGSHVNVGILSDSGMAKIRTPEGGIEEADVTLPQVAFWQEYGTRRGVPERPFIRNTHDKNKDKYARAMKRQLKMIAAGTMTMKQALGRLGEKAAADVKKEMRNLRTPPNAPATIAAKGSSNPLIDTGTLLRSVNYEVKL